MALITHIDVLAYLTKNAPSKKLATPGGIMTNNCSVSYRHIQINHAYLDKSHQCVE